MVNLLYKTMAHVIIKSLIKINYKFVWFYRNNSLHLCPKLRLK